MMGITKTGMGFEPLAHVLCNLRDTDRAEIFATRAHEDPIEATRETMRYCAPFGTLFWYDGEPVSALGYVPMWPGVVSVWAYGTDKWPKVLPSMTRHIVKETIPELLNMGFHRAECRALASRSDTHRWLNALGAHQEAVLHEFGRNREDFAVYVWKDYEAQSRKH